MNKVFSDFLAWTREHQWGCDESHDLTLADGTKLSVWDSGVLEVTPENPGRKDIILQTRLQLIKANALLKKI